MRVVLSILILALLVNTSCYAGAALSGTYIIGGASPDFVSIQAAVAELNANGIAAPVEFRISQGTYDEQVTINNFSRFGASDDTVTFRKVGPLDVVNWQNSSAGAGSDWVIKLDGAQYVVIRGMTFNSVASGYGDIILFDNGAGNNSVENCEFNGQLGIGSHILQAGLGNHPDNHFTGNAFVWGEIAIDFDYQFGGADSSGLVITGNTFSSQELKAIETGSQGAQVNENIFYGTTVSDPSYIGMDINDNAAVIEKNMLDISKGDAAIWVFQSGGAGTESRIVNNMIALRSSTASRGIYVATDNVSIYHNTVRSVSASAPAVYISSDSDDIRVQNNILQNDANGLTYRVDSGAGISKSDNNNFYSTAVPVIQYDGISYNNVSDYATATGLDTFSTIKAVTFLDTSGTNDLHLAAPSDNDVDLLSPLLASVTEDYDGDSRGVYTTYKGADEGNAIAPLDNADTVSGFYTIGGSSPDYLNPSIAIDDLIQRGTKGPVTFRVRAGNYPVHKVLSTISRFGNADDEIYFRAANISNTPTFQHSATNSSDNWIVKIENMDFIKFQYINFESTSATSYGRLLVLTGENDNFVLKNSIMTGLSGITDTSAALVFSDANGQTHFEFSDNNFNEGSTALYLAPVAFTTPQGTDLIVSNNVFVGQSANGLYTDYNNSTINNNQLQSSQNNVSAFYLQFNKNPQFDSNRILLQGTNSTAINLNGADGLSFANPSYISNNFIVAERGIDLYANASLFYMYHNSIVSDAYPVYANASGGGLEIINNILINSSAGPVLYVAEAADVDASDGNDFMNTSGSLIFWDGVNYNDLLSFQAASSTNLNSVSHAVTFQNLALANLHLAGASDGDQQLAGVALADITTDYDGNTRSINTPYMGADEASVELIGSYSVGGTLSGLLQGNSVTLRNNGNDDLILNQDGLFEFGNSVPDQTAYQVEVISEPSSPIQNCTVSGGDNGTGGGTINGSDVTSILVVCDNNDLIFRDSFDDVVVKAHDLNANDDLESHDEKGMLQPQIIPVLNNLTLLVMIVLILILAAINQFRNKYYQIK